MPQLHHRGCADAPLRGPCGCSPPSPGRAHIESLIRDAAAREVQSDLSRRVSSWRQRIGPMLQFEESRASFDIQDYGERLLDRLSTLKVGWGRRQGGRRLWRCACRCVCVGALAPVLDALRLPVLLEAPRRSLMYWCRCLPLSARRGMMILACLHWR